MRITSDREVIRRSPAFRPPHGSAKANRDSHFQRPYLATAHGRQTELAKIRAQWGAGVAPHAIASDRFSRCLDCCVALTLLLLVLPLLTLIFIAVKLNERGPALFAHGRIGRGGVPFACLKFRTMYCDADQRLLRILAEDPARLHEWNCTQKLIRDPRVTPVGRLLRYTSLDELPQLINVLRGEMSLVGPRPIIEDELERYGHYASQYVSVRPGLTGLWQVTRHSGMTYRRRVATDVHYVRNRSVAFDLYILVATIPAVFQGNG